MARRSSPETKVVSGIDVLDQTLFGLEHVVQDLVELPFSESRVQESFFELRIPVCSMLLIGILELFLFDLVSFDD
jgi:hypothetical protein